MKHHAPPRTLLDRLWDTHVIQRLEDGVDLLRIDRHLLPDLAGVISLEDMQTRHLQVYRPDLTVGIMDHAVSTAPDRELLPTAQSRRFLPAMRQLCKSQGIPLFDQDDTRHGIVHVVAPELGLTLPGLTIVCGDSHTCTHGAFGALAWGIGSSEVTHVLATQSIRQRKPQSSRVRLFGCLPTGVDAKDVALFCLARLGVDFGIGSAIEYAGPVVDSMSMDQRQTLCNLSVEMGAKFALIAPDNTTFNFIQGLPHAPTPEQWPAALAEWLSLRSDDDAVFVKDVIIDCSMLAPQVTWGTSPDQGIDVTQRVPTQAGSELALEYMGLSAGQFMTELAVNHVFIGSCAGGRLEDLQRAAAIVRGRRIHPQVQMWVVPGSAAVKRNAEALGLDRVFIDAGAQWRHSGCSMCAASNGEKLVPGQRCVSTTNRNFAGRQGPGVRTHLASPATAAASALMGYIADPRTRA
ncbi:MAG TPA: 3-isopropylmalate dehydratase large subunit [Burkholderiaceae bacterium]